MKSDEQGQRWRATAKAVLGCVWHNMRLVSAESSEGVRVSDHPAPEILDRFLRGELTPREGGVVLRHLLKGCSRCQAVLAPFVDLLFLHEMTEELLGEEPEIAVVEESLAVGDFYDAAIDRAFAAVRREAARLERESRVSGEAREALAADGLAGVTGRGTRRYRGPALCLALLRRSQDLRHENPVEMVRMAQIAVLTARNLDGRRYGAARVSELQAQAWAELGNAQRITGDLVSADRSLERALAIFHDGSQDPLLRAHILSLQASLLGDQRRFREALALLEQVEETYELYGDQQQAGKAIVKRGLYTGYEGDAEEAVNLLRRGLELIDPAADHHLAIAAVHNLATFLADAGHPREARAILWRNRTLFEKYGERVNLLKRLWLQGRIDASVGQLDRAALRLAEAQRGLDEAELGYQAALAALDLTEVWLRQGKSKMAAGLVEQAAETFLALGIDREAMGALHLLQQAFEREVATLAVVQRTIAFFRRFENDPAARFEP
jgi:tetratricopeptide (TPR) repeat protein